ncbi:MAG: 23S rRNA (pseudouridine(1915)-N(3))-methyltransferase RlmH [Veillonellaceae bacterium]|nr:23S rRNA (pseudouridine(1915)-N(3))-methyltransferase RlmH [Veillonellaceae bacterium]
MKFTIVAIGKIKEVYLRTGIDEFTKRLRPFGGVRFVELMEAKLGAKPSQAERQQAVVKENEALLKRVPLGAHVVVLDVYGQNLSSEDLSKYIDKTALSGVGEMYFIIGGAYGITDTLRRRANLCLSFSKMTFTHQMVRLLLVEQLYRSCKISHNEPYHW